MKTPTDHFMYGFVAAACLIAAIEDWMGQDAYVEYVKNNWVNLPWTFGALVFILVVALHFYHSRKSVFQPPSKE